MRRVMEAVELLRYILRCRAARLALYALLGTAAVFLAVVGAWWLPALHGYAHLEHDITTRRNVIVDAVREAGVAEAQRKAQSAVALLEKKLSAHVGQAELIRDVARLAAQRGMRVTTQSFDEGQTQSGKDALYLNLGLTGSYPSLRLLLNDFAALPVWLEVVEAHIERADRGGLIRVQLRLATYRLSGGHQ